MQHRLPQLERWLDYMVELGLNGLLLGPVFASETHGYDTLDHFRIDPRLGDEDDFDALIAGRARRGIKVVLDGVFNHVGRSFPRRSSRAAGDAGRRRRGSGATATAGRHFEGHDALVALNHEEPEVARVRRRGDAPLAGPGRRRLAARRRVRGAGRASGAGVAAAVHGRTPTPGCSAR